MHLPRLTPSADLFRSDPTSPKYGQHWSSEEIINHFSPSEETVSAVRNWLVDSGIASHHITHSANKGWLAFEATGAEAERLLKTKYHEHHDSISGGTLPACSEYHVPEHLREHIDYVTPGIKLFAPTPKKRQINTAVPKEKRSPSSKAKRAELPGVKAAEAKRRHEQGLQKRADLPGIKQAEANRRHQQGLEKRRGPLLNNGKPSHGQPFMRPAPFPAAFARGNGSNTTDLDTCDVTITPACIRALYQIPMQDPDKKVSPNNSMGIFESEAEYYAQVDLDLFFANFTPYIPAGTHPIADDIDGAFDVTTNVTEAGGEADLDLELAYPIVYPQSITIFQEDDPVYESNPNTTYTFGFNTFLDAIDGSYCTYCAYGECGDSSIDPSYPDPAPGGYKGQLQCGVYEPTNVISVSYGGQEVDVPIPYQKRQCNEYMKLGMQGVSILFASGDSGVSNYPAPFGVDGPTGCIGKDLNVFNPTWPNNCPWLTNVGATKVYPGFTVFEPESAVFDPAGHPYSVNYSSGGGFSNIYPVPDYQKDAVDTFFSAHNPPYPYYSVLLNDSSQFADLGSNGGIYNRIGRGIPDVSANGDNIAVSASLSNSDSTT